MQEKVKRTDRSKHYYGDIDDKVKTAFLLLIAISFVGLALITTPINELLEGVFTIITSPSNLLTDYISLAGLGATLVNSALLILLQTSLVKIAKQYMSGNIFANILMAAGHAFMGINPLNSLAPMIGVYIYAKLSKTRVKSMLNIMFAVTCLSPIVSVVIFSNLHPIIGITLGVLMGMLAGLITPVLSAITLEFHHGFTIYDLGFAAGIVAMILISVLRFMNFPVELNTPTSSYEGYELAILLALIYLAAILIAIFFSSASPQGYWKLMKHKGRLVDYQVLFGTGNSILNVGVMGLIAIAYVFIVGGPFAGNVIAGILAFGGYAVLGKNPRSSIPLMFGAFLAQVLNPNVDPAMATSINAALFSTALSPITGEFGIIAGVIAGFIHASVVVQVTYLHGGVDLYNNGFASGFVAIFLTGVLYFIRGVQNKRSKGAPKELSRD